MSLGQILERSASLFPDRIAIVHEDIRITYRDLNGLANSLATELYNRGLRKGNRVAIMLPNSPEFVIAYFAIQKIGAVAVTINTASTPYELTYLLGNCEASAIISTSQLAPRFEQIRMDLPSCSVTLFTDGFGKPSSFTDAIHTGGSIAESLEISPDDPAAMIYTSGLTGRPLGAVLTHRNLLMQSNLVKVVIGCTEQDRGLCLIPLFHAFGAAVNMLNIVSLGATMVIFNQFKLDKLLKTIEQEKITFVAAVPALFLGMLFHPGTENYDLSSVQYCITGGSSMPPQFIPEFEKKFNVKIMEGYGLTEASPVCTFSRFDMQQKPGSIGVAVPGVELAVWDEADRPLPPGQIGELVVRGENVMQGYYQNETATAAVIRNGWLHTGDLALMDEEGYVFLKGLKKRMIITNGFNVYPQEVENILNSHPAVQASRVVGKGDLMRGEIVKALIVKKAGVMDDSDEKAILKHCRTYLSSYKVPREIEFVDQV